MWPATMVRAARSSVQSEVAAITSRVRKSPTIRLRGSASEAIARPRSRSVMMPGIARVDVDHGQRRDAAVEHDAGRLLERLVGRDRDHALA